MVRKIFGCLLLFVLFAGNVSAQVKPTANNGHSHNDYRQQIPLLTAYYANMGSIEADVFLTKGELYVAHEKSEIRTGMTLKKVYLEPLAAFYKANGNHPYKDPKLKLQLVIDIKEDYKNVLPRLIQELKSDSWIFDTKQNPEAIRIVISGDVPPVEEFKNYPEYIWFDGRPSKTYHAVQLERIAMISDDIAAHTVWNGKGTPTPPDLAKLKAMVDKAHQLHKPFRFWGTKDNVNSWKELENIGADWIGTDHPEKLTEFYSHRGQLEYTNPKAYTPYQPDYKSDGRKGKAKNVILLIGDGMGLAQIQAGLSANFGKSNLMQMRYIGLSRTEASNSDFTDSAAGATAFASGKKTNNRYIGMDADGKKLDALPDTLALFKVKSGIISSGDITDATPAAFYAHQTDRSMSKEIAADLPASHVDILVGSNRKSFTENGELMKTLAEKGYNYSKTLDEFKSAKAGKQLVLLADSVTRSMLAGRGEMLKNSLLKTIELLSDNKQGFFIMAEGAQVDYGGHANNLPYVIAEQHDFDSVVGEALKFADQDKETLVIVTADHETGGLSLLDASYRSGKVRGNFSTDDHTNIMVPVFAYGPGAENFIGVYPNNELFNKIINAYGLK